MDVIVLALACFVISITLFLARTYIIYGKII